MTFKSARPNLELALQDVGVRLGPADLVDPPINAAVVAGMRRDREARQGRDAAAGHRGAHDLHPARQLKEALADIGLTLASDDRIEPGARHAWSPRA